MINKFDIERIKEGDLIAFRDLFNLLYPKLLALSTRYVTESVGEDLVQDVLMTYWEKRAEIDADNIQAYLYRWLQNSCLNYLKHEKVIESHHIFIAEARMEYMNRYIKNNDVLNEIDFKDLLEQVESIVSKLPLRTAEAFRLCYFKELSHKEAAQTMNISVRTIETHIRQAVLSLRKNLSKVSLLLIVIINHH